MKIPQLKLDNFGKFLKSREVQTIGAAILITPMIQGVARNLVAKIPFLKNHLTVGLIIVAFIVFVFASRLGGSLQIIGIGVAGGLFITAISPIFERFFGDIAKKIPRG